MWTGSVISVITIYSFYQKLWSSNTTLCDKVCQWLATGQWFSPGTPVSFTNKTDHQDIAEILLIVVLNTITPTLRNTNADTFCGKSC